MCILNGFLTRKKKPCRKLHFLVDWFSVFSSERSSGSIKIQTWNPFSQKRRCRPSSPQQPGECCMLRLERNAVNRPVSTNNLPKLKTSDPDGFIVNSTKHLRKKLYQFSIVSFRSQKQREYQLIQRPTSPKYQNQTETLQENHRSLISIGANINKILAH